MSRNHTAFFIVLLLIVILVMVYGVIPFYYKTYTLEISPEAARAAKNSYGLIIDVRTPKEREELGFYPNSIPISIEKLRTEVPLDLAGHTRVPLLVYSNGDARAALAAETLYDMGYQNVKYIKTTYDAMMPPGRLAM